MKKKKINFKIGIIVVILIVIVVLGVIFIQNIQNENKVKQTLIDFISQINEKNYEAMYEKVIDINMSKEDFISRNKNIYEGIDSQNIQIEIQKVEKKNEEYRSLLSSKDVYSSRRSRI